MRVSSCNLCLPSSCFSKSSPAIHSPSVVQLGDGTIQSLDEGALEKKPSCGDCVSEVKDKKPHVDKVSERGLVDGQCEDGLADIRDEIVMKSSLKRPRKPGMEEVRKGRVKWMDILGKELVNIQEFEASESEDSEADCGDQSCRCTCVIQ